MRDPRAAETLACTRQRPWSARSADRIVTELLFKAAKAAGSHRSTAANAAGA
jgi:hypothetical protein